MESKYPVYLGVRLTPTDHAALMTLTRRYKNQSAAVRAAIRQAAGLDAARGLAGEAMERRRG